MEIFGIRFVGLTAENGRKLLLTVAFIFVVMLLRYILTSISKLLLRGRHNARIDFWVRQVIGIISALLIIVGVVSIWFDDPTRLTTAAGLVTAGLAFALQKVVTAVAGYIVILRGRVFNVGDRIAMGGVRGDVVALSFMQTTIMEMGQSLGEQKDDPAIWVKSRQYTGRIVTITNDKVFDEAVYNYTREFPYLWEEMTLPVSFKDDRQRVEQILLDVTERHTEKYIDKARQAYAELGETYSVNAADLKPKVYWRITDNWVEMTVRFITHTSGTRALKDAMSRDILAALDEAGIGIASTTYEIVGLPPLRVENSIRVRQENGTRQERV